MTDDDEPAPSDAEMPGLARREDPEASAFVKRPPRSLVQRTIPITRSLDGYQRRDLTRDVVAGVTVGALALPSAMAFAELAGLPAVAGLYGLLLPTLAYTLLGSSKQLIIGPEAVTAALVATAVIPIADGDAESYVVLASALAVLVGAVFAVARLLRLGWLADYFSRAVNVGYIHGVALSLIIGQLEKLAGLDVEADDPFPQLVEFVRELDDIAWDTLAVGLASLALLFVLKTGWPKLPGPLIVVVLAIAASWLLDLEAQDVAVVGSIPSGLPGLEWPGASARDFLALLPGALGIVFVSYSDTILTGRAFAGRRNAHIDANQELLALSASNAVGGLSQAFPISASGSRTAVNDQMGNRTQLAGLAGAATIAVVLLFLTAPMELLPSATLGAVIIYAAVGLVNPAEWRALAETRRSEVVIAGAAFAGVLTVGILPALIIAVLLSIIDVTARSAHPHDAVLGYVPRLDRWADVSVHPSARVVPGVVVYRLDDRLFFANAEYVQGRIREAIAGSESGVRWLVFDAEGVSTVDASGLDMLEHVLATLRSDSIGLAVARAKQPLVDLLERAGLVEDIGRDRFFPTVGEAVRVCAGLPPDPE